MAKRLVHGIVNMREEEARKIAMEMLEAVRTL